MGVEGLSRMVKDNTNMRKKTFSLTDKTVDELERIVEEKYQNMKGALSLIVENALQEYFKKAKREE